jgi:adenine phosphoribosyltransferase
MDLTRVIRDITDFPKSGVVFRDLSPIFEDPSAFRAAVAGLKELLAGLAFERFAAIESRGFMLAGPLAVELDRGVALVRKAGKLPCATHAVSYALEYGEATIELHQGVCTGKRVVVLDDLLATGGTAAATAELIRKDGGEIAAYLFLVELEYLEGRPRLADAPVLSLVRYA